MSRALVLLTALQLGGVARQAVAQTTAGAPAPADTVRLTTLVADALRADPRQRQLGLDARASSLRLQSIDAERLPAFAGTGYAQYASRVVTLPIKLPGISPPLPPHDTYDAHVEATETLLDPTRAPRRAVERAQLAESEAGVRVSVFATRAQVEDAFFVAFDDAERAASTEATITDLQARLAEARERFHAGTALPGDTATIAATLLQRRQDLLQLRADERAARARLAELAGHDIPAGTALVLPNGGLDDAATAARAAIESGSNPRARPEFAQFGATRARLAAEEAQIAASRRPQISAFVHGGVGRPGLDFFNRSFQDYYTAGVQFRWAPFDWNSNQRNREELELEREVVATNDSAFAQSLRRGVQVDLATIERLAPTLALDDSIVSLRQIALREARAQLGEGAITTSAYLDRSTDLLSARLTRTEHRVSLAQARVHLLDTLGLDLPSSR